MEDWKEKFIRISKKIYCMPCSKNCRENESCVDFSFFKTSILKKQIKFIEELIDKTNKIGE